MTTATNTPPRHWQDLRGIATHLGVAPSTVVDRFITAGLPHSRVGRRYLFDPDEVDRWLRDHPGDSIDRTLERLHQEWVAGGGVIDDRTAQRIADALAPARRRRTVQAERRAAAS